jgi:hypothetical protein
MYKIFYLNINVSRIKWVNPIFNESILINMRTENFFSKDINEYCAPFCPMECDSIDYKIDLMSSVFPNQAYASELALHRKIKPKYPNGTNITWEDLRASVVAFSVYYSDFKYTYIKQLPKMQIVDAVSNFV